MSAQPHAHWRHRHDFLPDHGRAEHGTAWVIALTAVTMIAEIVAGAALGSMALLADGWHMATHVAAFGIAIWAYRYARRHARDQRFGYGTAKVTVLGGFASAVALAVVAVVMAVESVARLFDPREIRFDEATWVAALGLAVNLVCGIILHRAGHHDDHGHGHDHGHDHDLRATYLHVLADALTSVLAIAEEPGHEIADLHVWPVGPGALAATVSVVTHAEREPAHFKAKLEALTGLSHVVVEVNPCRDARCALPRGTP